MDTSAEAFAALHVPGTPLLMPNPFDVGSARILESLGFRALGTTSNGHAATLGRPDGALISDEVLTHAARLVAVVEVPVSADLEDGFAEGPAGVRAIVARVATTGIAGCSIEDWRDGAILPLPEAVERVGGRRVGGSWSDAPHRTGGELLPRQPGPGRHDHPPAGVPGGRRRRALRAGTDDAGRGPGRGVLRGPAGIGASAGRATVAELASVGVARISVGGAFGQVAYAALARAAADFRDEGTYGYTPVAAEGRDVYSAFSRAAARDVESLDDLSCKRT